jgi:CheY-like chemotaxis protein
VLVVDDDASIRTVVRTVLEADNLIVTEVPDGPSALAAIADEATRPAVVVLDIMMPGMDGHHVLQRIRSGAGRHLPVVMLTAAADDAQAWQAWTEGVDYFLAKPFDPLELLRFLDNLFEVGTAPATAPVAG